METQVFSDKPPIAYEDVQLVQPSESAENFQKFIYDLFEKNGVLSDLRSYLRGHIVDVLKNAETGTTPACQKNFTHRLELKNQALNILIAEYLLQMEFTYSFSVFISEMPLTNMVFGFAKSLLKSSEQDITKLRFDDGDVWSVLNYLGIQCDSQCATTILDSYRSEDISLLNCILNTVKLHTMETTGFEQDQSSESQSSSLKSSDTPSERPSKHRRADKCVHYSSCRSCQRRYSEVRERYREKRRRGEKKKAKEADGVDLETMMRNISVVETNLIDEMFQQMKSVYEAEIEMLKSGEQERIRSAVAAHALQLRQRAAELEASHREREASLEASIRQKKQILYELAQNLKQQQQHMREKGRRLTDKEEYLKHQLLDSEEKLRKQGEDMRIQITQELAILQNHLKTLKSEKERLTKEKHELEILKTSDKSGIQRLNHNQNNEDLNIRYDVLRSEISTIKSFMHSKVLTDHSTITELHDVNANIRLLMNNEQGLDRVGNQPTQLVNDFKKKNVNFCSPPPAAWLELTEENERLKNLAREQRDEIEALLSSQRRYQSSRPRSAGQAGCVRTHPFHITVQSRLSPSPVGPPATHNGAGEELGATRARVQLPSDAIPFIGPLGNEGRRHLMNQWRTLRRLSPRGVGKRVVSPGRKKTSKENKEDTVNVEAEANAPSTSSQQEPDEEQKNDNPESIRNSDSVTLKRKEKLVTPKRERSPTTRSAKSTKDKIWNAPPPARSPSAELREAKLRLRKLELEAAAVERSYQEYRRRREGSAEPMPSRSSSRFHKYAQREDTIPSEETHDRCMRNFDKFLKQYPVRMEFKNKAATETTIRPIPDAYSERTKAKEKGNYLETPLNEFRKLYYSQNESNPVNVEGGSVFVPFESERKAEKEKSKSNNPNKNEVRNVEITNVQIVDGIKATVDSKNEVDEKESQTREDIIKKVNTNEAEYTIIVENGHNLYNITRTDSVDNNLDNNDDLNENLDVEIETKINEAADNLVIEVENVKTSSIQVSGSSVELVYEIESSVATQEVEICSTKPEDEDILAEPITIDVVTKKSNKETVELKEIYQSKDSKGDMKSGESTSNKEDDYPEDFSPEASGDSISDCLPSPLSLGQTVNDDAFWD